MRLFAAIEVPEEVRKNLTALLREFREISPQTKWVRPENMHLTLKFLGETDPAQLDNVKSALAAIRSPQPVTLEVRGLSFFPNPKGPHVFWASVQSSPNLHGMVKQIDHVLHKLGFPLEDRPFAPHLTLARLNQAYVLPMLNNVAAKNASRTFGSFSTGQFHLIESKLKSAGAEYTTLQSYSFAPEA